jgi:hypothetical protein
MADAEPDEPRLKIDLTARRVCCPLHSEPFRESGLLGWMPFGLTLLQAALASPTLKDEAEQDEMWLNGALDRVPLCERVEKELLLQAYIDCGLGKLARCDNCGVPRVGVPMRLLEPGNVVPQHRDHVCFYCVVYMLKEKPRT